MLTACGGGGSSSGSNSSSDGGSSTNFNTQFTSSLVITDASGYKTTVRDQADQGSITDDNFAYTTISELASNTRAVSFALQGSNSLRAPTIRVYFDINTQKVLSIGYDEDENSGSSMFYLCSPTTVLCNQTTLSYNKNTGASTVNFSNQALSSSTGKTVKLNGQLAGKLANAPVDVADIAKTSVTNISVNGSPVVANSASIIASNSNTRSFRSMISLSNGDSLELISNNGLLITAVNYFSDQGTVYFSNLNNAAITANSNDSVTINLNNISQNNIFLTGNITLQKPKSTLKVDGATPEAYNNILPIISNSLIGVNNFTLYNTSSIPDNANPQTQTDLSVVANGNTIYAVNIDFIDAANGTGSEYSCDPSVSQTCKGATVSSNGNQINFNNTVLYRQSGSSMTKSSITVTGSFNTQGR